MTACHLDRGRCEDGRSYARITRTRRLTLIGALALGAPLAACARNGGGETKSTAPRDVGALPPPPAAPAAGLAMPALTSEWMPPMITAGSVDGLARTLRGHDNVAITLGPTFETNAWEKRAVELVGQLSAKTTVVGRERAFLRDVMIERGKLPIFQQLVPSGGVDLFGRPTYIVNNVTLDTEWAGKQKALRAADGFVAIDVAEFDLRTWRDVRVYAVGSCEGPMGELALARAQAEETLMPFAAWADRVLVAEFHAHVEPVADALTAELGPYSRSTRPDDVDSRTWACGRSSFEVVEQWRACGDQPTTCPIAPRWVDDDGLSVAMREPGVYLADDCAERIGVDVRGRLIEAATNAALRASERFDPRWLELGARIGAVARVQRDLAAICQPRRRRFWAEDVAWFRGQLAAIGATLQAPGPAGTGAWLPSQGIVRVEGRGAMRELIRWSPGEAHPVTAAARQSAALTQAVRERQRCSQIFSWLPFMVSVADTRTGELEFFGYFYDEELFCQGMPPLLLEEPLEPPRTSTSTSAQVEGGDAAGGGGKPKQPAKKSGAAAAKSPG